MKKKESFKTGGCKNRLSLCFYLLEWMYNFFKITAKQKVIQDGSNKVKRVG